MLSPNVPLIGKCQSNSLENQYRSLETKIVHNIVNNFGALVISMKMCVCVCVGGCVGVWVCVCLCLCLCGWMEKYYSF